MAVTTATNLDYLISRVRFYIGDSAGTRYTDDWLQTSLQASVGGVMPYWSDKYYLDADNNVVRNTAAWSFTYADPPIIQNDDSTIICLMSSFLVLSGALQDYSWNLGSWKDAEISYSNIAGGRSQNEALNRIKLLLDAYLLPPTKRLKNSLKGSLPGYKGNKFESGADF